MGPGLLGASWRCSSATLTFCGPTSSLHPALVREALWLPSRDCTQRFLLPLPVLLLLLLGLST